MLQRAHSNGCLRSRRLDDWLLTIVAALIVIGVAAWMVTSTQPAIASATLPAGVPASPDPTRACVYATQADLLDFDSLVGQNTACALVFDTTAPDWASWELPWFVSSTARNTNWAEWVKSDDTHSLVITQSLFPLGAPLKDWLRRGASGDFDKYAQGLAVNLVGAGLGSSVIRLGHEANGDWYADSVPADGKGQQEWRDFWRHTALAMKSVSGAHFKFDWSVSYTFRPITFSQFYPGDDVVDVIGLDAYDRGVQTRDARWQQLWSMPGGIQDFLLFAAQHKKPISFPEWGLWPADSGLGGGADSDYMAHMVSLIHLTRPVYQTYWYGHEDTQALLRRCSPCIAAYQTALIP